MHKSSLVAAAVVCAGACAADEGPARLDEAALRAAVAPQLCRPGACDAALISAPLSVDLSALPGGLRLRIWPEAQVSLSLVQPPDGASLLQAAQAADGPGRDLIVNSPTYSYKDARGVADPKMPRSQVSVHGLARVQGRTFGASAPQRAWLAERGVDGPGRWSFGMGDPPEGLSGLGGPAPLILGGERVGLDLGRPNKEADLQAGRADLLAFTLIGLHPGEGALVLLSAGDRRLSQAELPGALLRQLRDLLAEQGLTELVLLDPAISSFLVEDGQVKASSLTPHTDVQVPFGLHLSMP